MIYGQKLNASALDSGWYECTYNVCVDCINTNVILKKCHN